MLRLAAVFLSMSFSALAAEGSLPQEMKGRWTGRENSNSVEVRIIDQTDLSKIRGKATVWTARSCIERNVDFVGTLIDDQLMLEFGKSCVWKFSLKKVPGKNEFAGTYSVDYPGSGTAYLRW